MTTSEWFAYRWSDAASRLASLPLWFWLALGLGLASVILLNYLARFLAVIADQPVRIADAAVYLLSHRGLLVITWIGAWFGVCAVLEATLAIYVIGGGIIVVPGLVKGVQQLWATGRARGLAKRAERERRKAG
jgi:hypothetical protein